MSESLRVGDHAVQRYRERVRPDLSLCEARYELTLALSLARPCRKPRWVRGFGQGRHHDRWLALERDVVAVVHPNRGGWEVGTVLCKGDKAGRDAFAVRQAGYERAKHFHHMRPRKVRRIEPGRG